MSAPDDYAHAVWPKRHFSRELWFSLPPERRWRWWNETEAGTREPSAELLAEFGCIAMTTADADKPREMIGLWEQLSDEQKAAALAYRGGDNIGDPVWERLKAAEARIAELETLISQAQRILADVSYLVGRPDLSARAEAWFASGIARALLPMESSDAQ